ncbi:MAG: hypothetical protein FJ161_01260, partial [Gammaproteobacteria bacterium]|nr:hypothetical protein [Gammaproteobacteria bacterium]
MQYHPFNQSELITSYNQESYKLSKDTEILLSPFGVCLGLSAYMHYSYFSQTHTDTSSNTINPPSLFTTFEQFKNDTSIFDNPDRCTTLISQIQNHEFSTVQNPYIHSSEYQTQRLYNLINTCLYSYATWSCHLLEFASETINMLHDMSIPNFDAKNFKMLNLQEPNSRLQTMQHCSIVQTHQINYLLTQSSWNTFFDLQSPNCPFVAGGSYIINSQPFDSIETKDQNIAMLHVMAVIIDRSGSILFFDPSSMLVCDLKNALLTETQSKKIQGALGLRIMTNNEPDHSSDSVRDMTMLQITSISDARTHFARLEESIFIINRMNECVYNLKDIDPLNLSSALLQKAIGFSLLNDDPIVFEKFAYTFLSKQNNLTIEQAREQFEQAILTMPWCFEMHLLPPNILSSVFEKIWNKEHSLAAFLHYPKIIKNSGAPDFIYFKTLKNFCKDKKIPFVFELSSKEFTQISVTEWQLIFEQLSHIAESDMVLKRLKSQFRKNHAIGIWPFITLKTVSERDEYFKKLSDAELI